MMMPRAGVSKAKQLDETGIPVDNSAILEKNEKEDEKDRVAGHAHENSIDLGQLSKKIQKRIKIIDNLVLKLKDNQRVYFFFGHTGVGVFSSVVVSLVSSLCD
jgi:hypothetical protein